MAKTAAQPTYVMIDPDSEEEIARFNGAPRSAEKIEQFTEFLKLGAR